MRTFLLINRETDSVAAETRTVADALAIARERGITDGYIDNQDGGRAELADLLNA